MWPEQFNVPGPVAKVEQPAAPLAPVAVVVEATPVVETLAQAPLPTATWTLEPITTATHTPVPTETATNMPVPTVTPTAPPHAVAHVDLYRGPGAEYERARQLVRGQPVDIRGRTEAGDWYLLADGTWVAALAIGEPPGRDLVPVAFAPALPTATPVPTDTPMPTVTSVPVAPTNTPVPVPPEQAPEEQAVQHPPAPNWANAACAVYGEAQVCAGVSNRLQPKIPM